MAFRRTSSSCFFIFSDLFLLPFAHFLIYIIALGFASKGHCSKIPAFLRATELNNPKSNDNSASTNETPPVKSNVCRAEMPEIPKRKSRNLVKQASRSPGNAIVARSTRHKKKKKVRNFGDRLRHSGKRAVKDVDIFEKFALIGMRFRSRGDKALERYTEEVQLGKKIASA